MKRPLREGAAVQQASCETAPIIPPALPAADRLYMAVPNELRPLKAWLLWKKGQPTPGGKFDKIPYYVSGRRRSGTQGSPEDLAGLVTFDEALITLRRGGYDGMGLAMLDGQDIVGLDFDGCRGEDGVIAPWVLDLCRDTYMEISPSGTGVRAFYRGTFPDRKNHAEHIEVFCRTGFLTVTGERRNGCDLAKMSDAVASELTRLLGPDKVRSDSAAVLSGACARDPNLARLNELGLVLRDMGGGKFAVTCPFQASHTTPGGSGDAVYFTAHTGGYASGNFDCKHAHCAERPQAEFRAAIGLGPRELRGDGLPPLETYAEDVACAKTSVVDESRSGSVSALPRVDGVDRRATEERVPPAQMDEAAYHGLAGKIVKAIEPHTEADPAALLIQVLVAFGTLIKRSPYYQVEGDRHYSNLFALLIGNTAKGRKGTSWGRVRSIFELVPGWSKVVSGLSSGEGLKWQVRDKRTEMVKDKKSGVTSEEVVDEGVADKRLLVIEPEFAQVLRVVTRHGNTLSSTVRTAWDTGTLATLTKNDPVTATDAHIAIIGHVTVDELRAELTQTDTANGFSNRFLFVCVKRSKCLPFGGEDLPENVLRDFAQRLERAASRASSVGGVVIAQPARKIWARVYPSLSVGMPGLFGAATARAEAQALRLAMLYALLDEKKQIDSAHLMAGLAVWEYASASAQYVFGSSLGDPVADEILRAVRAVGKEGMSRTRISGLFQRNRSAERIGAALDLLARRNLVRRRSQETGGRPSEVWEGV